MAAKKQNNEYQHISALEDALGSIDVRFYAPGTVKRPLTLTWGKNTATFPMSLAGAQQQLKALVAASTQSAFGHIKKTVIDTSVRVARELTASQISVDFDPAEAGILRQVHQALLPEAASVRAELYKLNVMETGGFFKPHKDTPRGGTTCFGTLVVCLPVPFQGGSLKLQHGNKIARQTWSHAMELPYGDARKRVAHVPTKAGLQWVAFFGDVEHEVEKISEGYRITLTYTLHRDTPVSPSADLLLTRASGFHTALQAALADKHFMTKGGAIGVYCKHLYEEDALAHSEAKLAAGGSNAYAAQLKLKNEDAVVAAVLSAAGLKVQCLRMLTYSEMYEFGPFAMKKMPTKADARDFGSTQYIDSSFKAKGVTSEDVGMFCDGHISEKVGQQVTFLESRSENKRAWVERWYSSTDYFGNECEGMTFYTSAAIAGVVPPFAQRKKLLAAAKKKKLTAQMVHPDLPSITTAAAAAAGSGGGSRGKKRKAAGDAAEGTDSDAAADADLSSDQGVSDGDDEDWQPAKRGKKGAAAAAGRGKQDSKKQTKQRRKCGSAAAAAAGDGDDVAAPAAPAAAAAAAATWGVPRLFASSPEAPAPESLEQEVFSYSEEGYSSDESDGWGRPRRYYSDDSQYDEEEEDSDPYCYGGRHGANLFW